MKSLLQRYFLILFCVIIASLIVFPNEVRLPYNLFGKSGTVIFNRPVIDLQLFNQRIYKDFELKQGLDIQGGTQIVLRADMSNIQDQEREIALESARQVILRRVDLYGVNEPVVQSSTIRQANGQIGEYRIIVELAGVSDPSQALELIGTTAQLDFRLQGVTPLESTTSAAALLSSFTPTQLTGADLKKSTVEFDPQTNTPVVSLEFNPEGTRKFAEITRDNVNGVLGIFLDGYPLMLPTINVPIVDGRAIISGQFGLEEAKSLSIQLNAGALPVPIEVIQQRSIGASLGQESVKSSIIGGVIGVGLVMIFMILVYGWKGFFADMALLCYAVLTIAIYKLFSVTLTLPGIAGMLLSVGMAVDANILIFERMKEELRNGKPFELAMKLGFGRAWDSIKDANLATIFTAFVLINPLNLPFLNTSGLVRGFGVTLLIGVLISLFTGVVVTRTLLRLFLKEYSSQERL